MERAGAGRGAGAAEDPPELFEEQVARTPDATAVNYQGIELTYTELNERANRLACLVDHGIRPEQLVGLALPRSADLVVAILAVLKAGAAYRAGPRLPAERIAYMVADADGAVHHRRAQWTICRTVSSRSCSTTGASRALGLSRDLKSEARPVDTGHAAYVIYTSGSTGQPKRVHPAPQRGAPVHRHPAVVLLHQRRRVDLFHSYAFDFSVWELWGALLHGGRLVVVPYESAAPRVPATAQPGAGPSEPDAVGIHRSSKRTGRTRGELALRVVFGGRRWSSPADQLVQRHPQQPKLISMYGITETTVHVTCMGWTSSWVARREGSLISGASVTCASTCSTTSCSRCRPGGGQIYVGGAGVARGYSANERRAAVSPTPTGRRLPHTAPATWPGGAPTGGWVPRRADHQIKIAGSASSWARSRRPWPYPRSPGAVVVPDQHGDKRLVSYRQAGRPGSCAPTWRNGSRTT